MPARHATDTRRRPLPDAFPTMFLLYAPLAIALGLTALMAAPTAAPAASSRPDVHFDFPAARCTHPDGSGSRLPCRVDPATGDGYVVVKVGPPFNGYQAVVSLHDNGHRTGGAVPVGSLR